VYTCCVPYLEADLLPIHHHNFIFLSYERGDPLLELVMDVSHEEAGLTNTQSPNHNDLVLSNVAMESISQIDGITSTSHGCHTSHVQYVMHEAVSKINILHAGALFRFNHTSGRAYISTYEPGIIY
jgi:hypothetical protein